MIIIRHKEYSFQSYCNKLDLEHPNDLFFKWPMASLAIPAVRHSVCLLVGPIFDIYWPLRARAAACYFIQHAQINTKHTQINIQN